MILNGRNEINKNSGAHQKNFNEDRRMSVVSKCRPMHLVVIHTVYADIRRGSIRGGGVKYNKCKRLAVFQRGEFIRGQRHTSLRAASHEVICSVRAARYWRLSRYIAVPNLTIVLSSRWQLSR